MPRARPSTSRPLGALIAGAVGVGLLGVGAAPAAAAPSTVDIPAKPFKLKLDRTPTKNAALDRLKIPRRSVPQVLDDANRQATAFGTNPGGGNLNDPPGFLWQAGRGNDDDQNTENWFPQGITGSGDALDDGLWAGRRVLVTSWHSDAQDADTKPGPRVSFSTAEDLATSKYRHAMLVKPILRGGRPSLERVDVHAGGIAWYKRWLYVADTGGGLRVFDMKRIRQVTDSGPSEKDNIRCETARRCFAAGYKYVLPQVARYRSVGGGLSFSAVSLDRSTKRPTLTANEFCDDSDDYCDGRANGRIVRWRIDARTGLLAGATKRGRTATAVGAWELSGVLRAQGALTHGGQVAVSTSAGKSAGVLWRGALGGALSANDWVVGGEDLTWAPGSNRIYTATEYAGIRGVVATSGF